MTQLPQRSQIHLSIVLIYQNTHPIDSQQVRCFGNGVVRVLRADNRELTGGQTFHRCQRAALNPRRLCGGGNSSALHHVRTHADVSHSRPTPNNLSARDMIPTKVISHIQGPFRMRQGALL